MSKSNKVFRIVMISLWIIFLLLYNKFFYHKIKETIFRRFFLLYSLFAFTVKTSVDFLFCVCKVEFVGKLLLCGGDASRVFALDNINNSLGKMKLFTLCLLAVLNDIYRNTRIDIAEDIKVKLDFLCDFDRKTKDVL